LQPRRSAHGAQENWIATADRGLLRERAGTLELRGDVLLRYSDRDARFASEAMLINFDARTARSLAPVRAWDARGETRAEHLFVNLDSQFAALRGNVITRHAAID
jgi:LPS export ABC transporter protein LptC